MKCLVQRRVGKEWILMKRKGNNTIHIWFKEVEKIFKTNLPFFGVLNGAEGQTKRLT